MLGYDQQHEPISNGLLVCILTTRENQLFATYRLTLLEIPNLSNLKYHANVPRIVQVKWTLSVGKNCCLRTKTTHADVENPR